MFIGSPTRCIQNVCALYKKMQMDMVSNTCLTAEKGQFMTDVKMVEEICTECSGSGEGQWDGALCWRCKGWGVEYRFHQVKDKEKYCEYCQKLGHTDAECWCTRVASFLGWRK